MDPEDWSAVHWEVEPGVLVCLGCLLRAGSGRPPCVSRAVPRCGRPSGSQCLLPGMDRPQTNSASSFAYIDRKGLQDWSPSMMRARIHDCP